MIPHSTQLIQLVPSVHIGLDNWQSCYMMSSYWRCPSSHDIYMMCLGKLTLFDVVIAVYAYNHLSGIRKL